MMGKNVMLVQEGEQYIVCAREKKGEDWIEVERIRDVDAAELFMQELEEDDEKRATYIREALEEEC
jgi:hypothetical protein